MLLAIAATGIMLASGAPDASDEEWVTMAMTQCHTNASPSESVIRELTSIEATEGLPGGLLLAAACNESGYRADPGRGDSGRAVGMFQLWPWASRHVDRLDWRSSARFWAGRVVRNFRRAKSYCKGRRGYRSRLEQWWASAAVTAVRAPKRENGKLVPRCAWKGSRGESIHWKIRRAWERAMTIEVAHESH